MNLVIFHYHLLPGGVTSVISQAVASLRKHSRLVSGIQVVVGGSAGGQPRVEGADTVLVDEIDYQSAQPFARVFAKERAERLADALLERFGIREAVWWIHNYHIGKNPLFTEALLRLASSPGAPRMILQPHDFPEAGRYRNLAALERSVSMPLYPTSPNVRYALINQRDLAVLGEAGIPASRLFLLENPVSSPATDAPWVEDRRGMRALLFPDANPAHQTLLYPVRSIRRKNVLEAGLLIRLVDLPLRLVVTLPGVSESERAYSTLVEGAFRSGLIPGEFATGSRRPDLRLDRLAAACDAVVSSSVQEGFGYLFVQALQWGLPLVARSLDTAPGTDGLYDGYPAAFYDDFTCPLEEPERLRLLGRYRSKLRKLRRLLGNEAAERLEGEMTSAFNREGVDVSNLDTQLQMRLLAAAAHLQDFRAELRRLNPGISRSLGTLLSERPHARIREVEQRFGPAAYASRVDKILGSFDRPQPVVPCPDQSVVQGNVRAAFARAGYLRLLYD